MSLGEFKAFIEGMAVDKAPTEKQWALITEKLATLESISVTEYYSPQVWPAPVNIGDYVPCHFETTCEVKQ